MQLHILHPDRLDRTPIYGKRMDYRHYSKRCIENDAHMEFRLKETILHEAADPPILRTGERQI